MLICSMVIVVCWASAGPAVVAINTIRPVKVELRVAMLPEKMLEVSSVELIEGFGIESMSLSQEACQHIALAMGDVNGFGSAIKHRAD